MNFRKVLIWLKVNDIAFVEYESKEDDQRYFDYRTSKYFTKEELLNMVNRVVRSFHDPNQRARILVVPNKLIIYTSSLNLDPIIYEILSKYSTFS